MSDNDVTERKENELEFVAFRIGAQEYCINIMSVREIRGWTEETLLPSVPNFVRGVINLRGSVVPIIDLSARLGLDAKPPTARHVIIITRINSLTVGLLVDAVSDILYINSEEIQQTPDVSCATIEQFITGVIARESKIINLLDLGSILPSESIEAMAA